MFNKKNVFSGIVIIAALLLVTPKFFGTTAKNKIFQIQKIVAVTPLYQMEILEYEQGWFTSKAKIKIKADFRKILREMPRKLRDIPTDLTFDIDIAHGPIMILDGVHFGLVTMKSRFKPKIYNNNFNFKLVSHLRFFGKNEAKFSSDEIKIITDSKNEIIIDAFDYTTILSKKYDYYSAILPDFNISIKMKDGQLTLLKNFSVTSEGDKINDYLWTNKTKIAIEQINIGLGQGKSLNFNDLEYNINVEKENKNNLSLALNLNMEEVKSSNFTLNKLNYSILINKLSLKAITEYIETLTVENSSDNITKTFDNKSTIPNEVLALITGIFKHDIPNISEKITLKHLDIRKENETVLSDNEYKNVFSIDNVKFETYSNSDKDLNITSNLNFSEIATAFFSSKIRDYKHSLSINEISKTAIINSFEKIAKQQTDEYPDFEKIFTEAMNEILQNSPSFKIDQLNFKIDDGYFKGKVTSSIQGDKIKDNMIEENSEEIVKFIKSNGEISFNEEFIQAMVKLKTPNILSMDEKKYNEMIKKQSSQILEFALEKKYIVKEGDVYKSVAEFKNGKISINGKEKSLQ